MTTPGNHIAAETHLITGCIRGNRQMQELLYRTYAAKMYGVCLRYCSDAEDANDVIQDGFIKVFTNLHKFRKEGSFEGWMRRIFVNTAIEHFRKTVNVHQITEAQENVLEDPDWSVLDTLAQQDILHLVNGLAPGYKTVFNLHVIEGYSHKEIAGMLGITEGTSKSQLARAKGALKKSLEQRVGTAAIQPNIDPVKTQ